MRTILQAEKPDDIHCSARTLVFMFHYYYYEMIELYKINLNIIYNNIYIMSIILSDDNLVTLFFRMMPFLLCLRVVAVML